MVLKIEAHEQCKKCFHFQVCASVLKNDLLIREVMLEEKEPKCKHFVEVVRCKDCKHEQKCLMCIEVVGDTPLTTSSRHIDFCSYGERKDNGI